MAEEKAARAASRRARNRLQSKKVTSAWAARRHRVQVLLCLREVSELRWRSIACEEHIGGMVEVDAGNGGLRKGDEAGRR